MKKFTLFCGALLASVMTLNATVLFEGEKTIANWDENLQLSTENLPNLEEGCVIAITVSAVAKNETENQIPAISIQNGAWRDMTGCGKYDITTGVHTFVLSKANVDTIINTNGIIIRGSYYTYTKVELLYKKTLWTGTVSDNTGWQQSDELDKSLFASMTEGTLLGVTVSAINDGETWHQFAVRGREDDDTSWANLETLFQASVSATGTYVTVLTAEQATSYKTKNIDIAAQYLDVTELTTYVATKGTTPTAMEQTENASARSSKIFRNGQLIIRQGEKEYTVLGQEVK